MLSNNSSKHGWPAYFVLASCSLCLGADMAPPPEVTVGSKIMVESRILGEMLAHLARDAGAKVTHREGLGGTLVVWRALLKGDVDAYVEYTGTISAEILSGNVAGGEEAMRQALAEQGIAMSKPLGFNNTYAIGMRKDTAERLGIQK